MTDSLKSKKPPKPTEFFNYYDGSGKRVYIEKSKHRSGNAGYSVAERAKSRMKRIDSMGMDNVQGILLKRRSSPWPEVGFVYIFNKTYS